MVGIGIGESIAFRLRNAKRTHFSQKKVCPFSISRAACKINGNPEGELPSGAQSSRRLSKKVKLSHAYDGIIIDFINEIADFDQTDTLFLRKKCVRLAFPRDTPPKRSKRNEYSRRLREPPQNINIS